MIVFNQKKCYEVCLKHEKPVIVMEPVKGGTLVNIPEKAQKLFKEYNPDLSIASWGVRYAASLNNILTVLVGSSNLEQMEDNISYMKDFKSINDDETAIIQKAIKIINGSIAIPCTGCNYCVEACPIELPIPKYFTLYNDEKNMGFKGFSAQQVYYRTYSLKYGKVTDCTDCGACEENCPQHIEIRKYFDEIYDRFEKTM